MADSVRALHCYEWTCAFTYSYQFLLGLYCQPSRFIAILYIQWHGLIPMVHVLSCHDHSTTHGMISLG